MTAHSGYVIREAKCEDSEEILFLAKDLAKEQNKLEVASLDLKTFQNDGFGDRRIFHCFVAEEKRLSYENQTNSDNVLTEQPVSDKLVGFVLYLFHYSEYEGVYVFIESLYVSPTYRNNGIEAILLREVARVAVEKGCRRVDWIRDNWQREHGVFVEPEGVRNRSAKEGTTCFQLSVEDLKRLAGYKKNKNDGIIIRKAKAEDCEDIISLMKGLAIHDGCSPDVVTINAGTLRRDGFDSDPLFHCYVAEDLSAGGKVIAHTMHVLHYSPLDGASLFLTDLYVTSGYRKHGVASRLFQAIAKEGIDRGCKRLMWICYDWNEDGMMFYKSKGATNCTEKMGSNYFRLCDYYLNKFAAE